jgi:xylulose-5-phosphate/fructose-6-phosphate phosphoketolase
VRGYKEEGTTTTPFDLVVRNNMDRFQLAIDSLARLPAWKTKADDAVRGFQEKLVEHKTYVVEHGEDMPEVRDWRWTA